MSAHLSAITERATQQTPAELGDAIGLTFVAFLVVVALAVGLVSLIQWRDRHKPGDSFADDFIPDRATVADTERSLPAFGDPRPTIEGNDR